MKHLTIKSLLFLAISLGATSCLKKDRMNIDVDGGPRNVVEFANTGNNVSSALSTYPRFNMDLGSLATGESTTFPVNLSFSGVEVAPQDITVQLELSDAGLAKFNTENSSHYEIPDASIYSFPTSVVIPKGKQTASIMVTITLSAAYNFSKAYALPLKISSASYGTVSGNYGIAMFSFGARNQYDGMYSYSGSIYRNSASGPDLSLSGTFTNLAPRALATLSANSLSLVPTWVNGSGIGGVDGTHITIDQATNLVTVSATGNASMHNTVGETNNYDPVARKFTLAFDWGTAPNTRVATMVLTYIGPR